MTAPEDDEVAWARSSPVDAPAATGHPQVDAAMAALAEVADLPPVQQIGPLTDAHHVLRETLDSIGDV